MKKLISISLLVVFSVSGNAQINRQRDLSELSYDQLNIAFEKARNKTNIGIALTGLGIAVGTVGIWMGTSYTNSISNNFAGVLMTMGGIVMVAGGVPTWISGSVRKNKIELELKKYMTIGSDYLRGYPPIYGVGLTIRF